MADTRSALPAEAVPALVLPPGHLDREGRPPTETGHAGVGRWCPYCGADLTNVPVRDEQKDEAMFALAGRRLKVALAVSFVIVWLGASLYDWVNDPAANLLPGWFSALGAVMLVYLLGINPTGLLRRRG